MKSFRKHSIKGFTLVELLVVIAIIAILAVVGVTVYGGIQKNARDARRSSDVESIIKAIEVQKGSAATYAGLTVDGADFAANVFPTDTTTAKYGMATSTSTTTPIADPASWAATGQATPSGYLEIPSTGIPNTGALAIPANTLVVKICARLEKSTGTTGNGVLFVTCETTSQ